MHVLIINGSPRIKEYSNTDKILAKFTEGMCESGVTSVCGMHTRPADGVSGDADSEE